MEEEKKTNLLAKTKEIWKNKRYRSLIILAFYALFFVIVFVFLNINTNKAIKPPVPKTTIQNYAELSNYEFTLEVNIIKDNKEIKNICQGKTNQKTTIINDRYYLKDDKIYEIVNDKINLISNPFVDFDLFDLKPHNLATIIKKGVLNYETKYADGSIEKSYLVLLADVIANFDDKKINDPKSSVEVIIKEKNKQIKNIQLDLSNYRKYQDDHVSSYIVKITYNKTTSEPIKIYEEEV
ncbi:MAG: hypothetical protein RSB72_01240 [Bacilli bacterium]